MKKWCKNGVAQYLLPREGTHATPNSQVAYQHSGGIKICEKFMFFYGLIVGVLLCIGITVIILLLIIIHQLGQKINEFDNPL